MEVTMKFEAFVVKVPTNATHVQINNSTFPIRFDNTVLLPNGSRLGAYFRDCDIALVRKDISSGDTIYFKLRREDINGVSIDNISKEDKEYLATKGYIN